MLTAKRARKLVRVLLIFNGILTLLALPAVFLPTSTMESMHQRLGIGPFPEGPIVQYLARSAAGLYAAFGLMTLVLAYDIDRFSPLVTWWGLTAIAFGAIMFWVDHVAKMPAHWTWGEGPYLFLTGLLVLVAQGITRRTQTGTGSDIGGYRGSSEADVS